MMHILKRTVLASSVLGTTIMLSLLTGCSKEPTMEPAASSDATGPAGALKTAGQDFILVDASCYSNPCGSDITFDVYDSTTCHHVGAFHSTWYGSGYYTVRYDAYTAPGDFVIYDCDGHTLTFNWYTTYYIIPSDNASATYDVLRLHVDRYDPSVTATCATALWVIKPNASNTVATWDHVEDNCSGSWVWTSANEYDSSVIKAPFTCK